MCGIFGLIGSYSTINSELLKEASNLIEHRGPDNFGCYYTKNFYAFHHRLAIVAPNDPPQPIIRNNVVLISNGEIYNHKNFRINNPGWFKTQSDCEAILFAYEHFMKNNVNSCYDLESANNMLNSLDGIFGFLLIDYQNDFFIAARDPLGVNPLFMGVDEHSDLIGFSSEVKPFVTINKYYKHSKKSKSFKLKEIEGGHCVFGSISKCKNFTVHKWWNTLDDYSHKNDDVYESIGSNIGAVRKLLIKSVEKRLMADVPYAILLSGGLDSSILSAIAAKLNAPAPIHTYSVGFKGSSDIVNAELMAQHIGSIHHPVYLDDIFKPMAENESTESILFKFIEKAIYYIETFDVATIRSGIPMMIVADKIKKDGFSMVLDGDGSDEIFAGYEYFQYAPNSQELALECIRKVKSLCHYDCKRANHAMMSAGVECRCPYLDRELVAYAMNNINPKSKVWKKANNSNTSDNSNGFGKFADIDQSKPIETDRLCIEKWILRMAFGDMLPDAIFSRSKVQFSVGCGNSLINMIMDIADKWVTDEEFANAADKFPVKTPLSKEAMMYRKLFNKIFEEETESIVAYEPSLNCSTAKVLDWFKLANITKLDPCGSSFVRESKNT